MIETTRDVLDVRFLTAKDLARILNLGSPKRAYELPIHQYRIGRRVRFHPDDVRVYIEAAGKKEGT